MRKTKLWGILKGDQNSSIPFKIISRIEAEGENQYNSRKINSDKGKLTRVKIGKRSKLQTKKL